MIDLKSVIEALLIGADRPLAPTELKSILAKAADQATEPGVPSFKKVKLDEIESTLRTLAEEIESANRSYRLVCVAGAWQIIVQPEFAPWMRALAGERERPGRLSLPALETLAIIAYRQPITRAEIEEIRGVSVDGVIQTLLERGLIEPAGKADAPGRPTMYITTKAFLEHFGLPDLDHLPDAGELRRPQAERPPGLVTVEPGLATVPPDQLASQSSEQRQTDTEELSNLPSQEPGFSGGSSLAGTNEPSDGYVHKTTSVSDHMDPHAAPTDRS